MEYGDQVAPSNNAVLDHHPPQESTTVVGDEEQHHEKKSIMSRVQNRVNKFKHTINKKLHTHDEVSGVPPEEESEEFDENSGDMDVDSEVSSTHAVYDSPARDLDDEHEPLITPEPVKPHVIDGRDETPVTHETVLDSRHEPPVPPETMKAIPAEVAAVYDSLTASRQFDREQEPLNTPETVKPDVLDARDETPVTPESVLDGRHEPPVTPETMKAIPAEVAAVYDSLTASRQFDREQEPLNTPGTVKPHVLDARDETPVTPESVFHGRHEPPVTPETMKAISAEEEPIAPLPYGSIPPTTDDADTSLPTSVGPTSGNESSVPPEVISSLRAMYLSEQREGQPRDQPPSETQPGPEDETPVNHISSDMEKKPSYNEKLDTTAAAANEAAVSAESTEYPAGTMSGPTEGVEKEIKPSYSEQLSSSAFAAKDAAVAAASMVYAKVAGKEEGTHSSETRGEVVSPVSTVAGSEEGAGERKESYTEKLSGTALAAKDAAVMAASTVYGIVVGAGATMMGNVVEPEEGKGGSVREYLAEKLRPGEEDKALCEVISGSMKKGGEDDKVAVEKGRIELPEVTSREVVSDAPAEAITDALPAVDAKSGGYTGQGMVEKIRGSVTSLVGGRGGVADAPAEARGGVADAPAEAVSDAPPAVDAKGVGYTGQGMVGKIRGAVNSLVGGRGGVADAPSGGTTDSPAEASSGDSRGEVVDTPAVVVEAPSGGAGKERNSEGLGA